MRSNRSQVIPFGACGGSLPARVRCLAACLFSLCAAGCESTPSRESSPEPAASADLPAEGDSWLRSLRVDEPQWSPAGLAPGERVELELRLSFPDVPSGSEEESPWVAYPTIHLVADDPRVKVQGGGPSIYGLKPGMDCTLRFEIDLEPGIPVGTPIHFQATPSSLGFERGRARTFEFEVQVGK